MEKKKKTRFIVVWLLITAAFLAGSLLVPGHGKSESVQEAMRDAVLHGTNRISLFGLKDVNPAYISSLVVVGALLLAVLTYGVYVVRYLCNDSIRTEEDMEKYFGLMPLAVIPEESANHASPAAALTLEDANA